MNASGNQNVGSVLVVRHHVEDDAGLVGDALIRRGYELTTVMLDRDHETPNTAGYDAVVILGSNCSAYDPVAKREWFDRELAMMGELDAAGIPMFGVCFGAQALTTLFGGVVQQAARSEIGWTDVDVVPGASISSGPWFEYHQDHCLVPESANVLATSELCVQAFTIKNHLGVQFHPEIDDAQLARWFASESPEARAHTDHERELLEETAARTQDARRNTDALVSFFLEHGGLR